MIEIFKKMLNYDKDGNIYKSYDQLKKDLQEKKLINFKEEFNPKIYDT